MIWGVLADIHANLEALQASVRVLSERGARGYLCCGDVVGYGPSPNETVELLRGLDRLHAVSGNHDLAVLGRMDLKWFNPYAQAAAVWTRWKLSPASASFIESLPARVDSETFTLVHGSPRNPAEEYLLTPQQFLDNLAHFRSSPCFVGHSHLTWCFGVRKEEAAAPAPSEWASAPWSTQQTTKVQLGDGESVQMRPSEPWILNPGSVGQPRDHDPRASCGLYDDARREFRVLRVPYDVSAVQKRMLEVGLPEFLALRLSYGQ